MKARELARRLAALRPLPEPDPSSEQVSTPPEAAATLLLSALGLGDLADRSVADLGAGTGILAIGAAWLGARSVVAVERDARAAEVARENARGAGVNCRILEGSVEEFAEYVDTVVMNPPFGAQRKHADRPFWDAAFNSAQRAIYSFALRDSRSFIAARAVEAHAEIESTQPVSWTFPRTFPYHREAAVELPVDLWVIRKTTDP